MLPLTNPRYEINELLKKRPRFCDIISLPGAFYHLAVEYRNHARKRAKQENPPAFFCFQWARFLTACFHDRRYIDTVIKQGFDGIKLETESRQVQTYWDIGWTLCDIGYGDEGKEYLEKAIGLESRKESKDNLILALCLRLTNKAYWKEKLHLLETLAKEENVKPDISAILAKTYIEQNKFDKADEFINRLTKRELEAYGFLWAYFYFAQKNLESAVSAFEKYECSEICYFWRAEYDYKKALSYYYLGQNEKWHQNALRIGRRKKWDKFYYIDDISQTGIERVKEIDEIINSEDTDEPFFDFEKTIRCFKMMIYIVRSFLKWNGANILLVLLILLFIYEIIRRRL
jgi:hypothetical protein